MPEARAARVVPSSKGSPAWLLRKVARCGFWSGEVPVRVTEWMTMVGESTANETVEEALAPKAAVWMAVTWAPGTPFSARRVVRVETTLSWRLPALGMLP